MSFAVRFCAVILWLWLSWGLPVMASDDMPDREAAIAPVSVTHSRSSVPFAPSALAPMGVARLRSHVFPGVVIGGHYTGWLQLLQEPYTATGDVSDRLEELSHRLLIEELLQSGYPVASTEQESVFEEVWQPEEEPARFLIGGTITQVEFNTYETWRNSRTEDRRTIRWEVLDRDTNRIIAAQTTTGSAQALGLENPAATYEAIRTSFREFLTSEPLRQQLAQASVESRPGQSTTYAVTALLPQSDRLSVEQIARRSIPSIVRIRTPEGRGSGFFIDSSGLIVTNQHVVGSAFTVKVDLYDGSSHTARVLKRDAFTDVALVKVVGDELDVTGLPLCPTAGITVGQDVVAIGNPLSFANTVTQGIISGVRTLQHRHLLQTDVAINPGNSGGPLLNRQGAVVGIVTEKVASRGIEGLGFALPIQESLQTLGVKVQTGDRDPASSCTPLNS